MNPIWLFSLIYFINMDSEDYCSVQYPYMTTKEIIKFLSGIIFVTVIPIISIFLLIPYIGWYSMICAVIYPFLLLYYVYKKMD